MTNRGKSLSEVLSDTAAHKLQASKARFYGRTTFAEHPREVYLKACEQIAEALASDGFTYARSSQRLTRKTKNFSFQIYFQSDRNNVAGELIALWTHAGVFSKRLKAWRKRQPQPLHMGDGVAGGQIGNLTHPVSWMEWTLAAPDSRASLLSDTIATIRLIAFPYFVLFEDVPALCQRLMTEELPGTHLPITLEFLLCFGNKQMAEACFHRFLLARPNILERYRIELEQVRRNGIPQARNSGYAIELAYATVAYGLQPPR